MEGLVEEGFDRGLLDDLAGVHDHHPGGALGDDAEVVGDQEHGRLQLLLQLQHQGQNLGLNGHVQGGGRLVGDEEPGPAGQGHGDHDPLAHAPRELVRVILEALSGGRDLDLVQKPGRLGEGLMLGQIEVDHQRLGHLTADGQNRVERGHGLLEDHRDLAAPDGPQLLLFEIEEVGLLKQDASGVDPPRRLGDQTQDGQGGDGLAAAGFADQAEALSGLKIKGDPLHRPGNPFRSVEVDREVVYVQERLVQPS